MPVLARPPSELQPQQLEGMSTWNDAFKASFQETVATGPLGSLDIAMELNASEGGISAYGSGRTLSPMVALEDAKQRVKDAGLEGQVPLNYAKGLRQETLNTLIDLNKDKVRRQTLASQYDGWTPQIAGMVAGSIVDPANIALSVIPVVGEARYAQLLKNAGGTFGRFGVRAGVGALEGVVGAAAAEPFIYLGQQQWRNDYDFYDSALNIVGGAVFGSLLHGGAGLVADRFGVRVGEAHIEAQAEELKGALTGWTDARTQERLDNLAERAQGGDWMRPLDADRGTVEARLAEEVPSTRAEAIPRAFDSLRRDIEADLTARSGNIAEPNVVAGAKADLATVTRELDSLEGQRREIIKQRNAEPGVTRKQAESLADAQIAERRADLEGRKSRAESQIASNKDAADAVAELSALQKTGALPESWRARVESEADRLIKPATLDSGDLFAEVRPLIAALDQSTQAGSLRMAIGQALQGQKIDVTPAMLGDPMFRQSPAAYAAAREGAIKSTTNVAEADLRASEAATAKLASASDDTSIEDARALLADLEERMTARGLDPKAIEIDDAEIKLQNEGAKVATMCMMRNAA